MRTPKQGYAKIQNIVYQPITKWTFLSDEVRTENEHSGLELELQFMPRFFMENPGALTPHIHEFYQIIWFRRGHGCITLIS